jgi:tetratricopeptide (TPR) repeat protein
VAQLLASWSVQLLLILLTTASLSAAPVTVNDPLTMPGWQHFYNNEYDQAISDFESEARREPNNPDAYNHLAQAVLYKELFRNGVLESQLLTGTNSFLHAPKMNLEPAAKERFESATAKAIALAEERLEKNEDDSGALYALSVTHGLRANYYFLVEKSWTESLRAATASRRYSNRVLEVEPNLTDALLVQGLHDYVVGSLPFYVRMMGAVAGVHGNRDRGLRELNEVALHGTLNKYDAQILLAVIYRRERQPLPALSLLKQLSANFPRNYLLQLEQAQMYSDLGNKSSALAMLDQVEQMRSAGRPSYRSLAEEKVKYLRGDILFWHGDLASALTNFREVTQKNCDVDRRTAVLAWLRLGQTYDLQGDHQQAIRAYQETVKAAPESSVATEAKNYISSPYHRRSSANANGSAAGM